MADPTDLAALARFCADEIEQIWPAGPVRLLGYSFGGALAYRIAAELIDRGRVIGFLGMLDTNMPESSRGLEWNSTAAIRGLLIEMGIEPPSGELTIEAAMPLVRSVDQGLAMLRDDQAIQVVENYLRSDHLLESASFCPLSVDVTFVEATLPEPGFGGLSAAGWRSIIGGDLTVLQADCGHSEVLSPATLKILGPLIGMGLQRS